MVRHVMADGSKRESIDGYVVQINDKTHQAYKVLAEKLKGDAK